VLLELKVQTCAVWSKFNLYILFIFSLGLGAIYHPAIEDAEYCLALFVNHCVLTKVCTICFISR
jgi:hypothetical protein